MNKRLEWKIIFIGSITTIVAVFVAGVIVSALSDIILYSLFKRPFQFSLFPKDADGFVIYSLDSAAHSDFLDHYEKTISLTIGLAVTVVCFFFAGFITARKAKSSAVLNGTLAGAIISVLLLSWATPIYIGFAYFGALLASRKKSRQTIE